MIVVDVNVVAYFFIEGDRTDQARSLFDHDPDWRLPPLWRHEFLNVLATYVRQGGALLEDARALWAGSVELLAPGEQAADMEAALALAAGHRVSAYDAQYIVLAQRLETPCITEDRRLLDAFPAITRSMRAFVTG